MNTEQNIISKDKTTDMLKRLNELNSTDWRSTSIVIGATIIYGFGAYVRGLNFLSTYLGALVVMFLTCASIELKLKKQTELIKEIFEELLKTKTEPSG